MAETWIEIGILALLVYLPLDFGGVTPRPLMILELGSSGLGLLWILSAFLQGKREKASSTHNYLFPTLCLLFLTVIFFQLIPLPAPIVKYLSPSAYELYAEGASATNSALPRFLSWSVCSQAAEEDFMKLTAYGTIFFLLFKTIRTRRQRKRLLYTILSIGFLETLYGLIQFVSGNHSIYTRQVSSWVYGTFVNKNHFAAYMEMVILLVFGLLVARFKAAANDIETPPEEKYIKAFFFAFVLVMMVSAHLLSGSRGGFISLGAGMLCFLLLLSLRGLSGKKLSIVMLVFMLTLGTVIVFQAEKILPRLETLTQERVDASVAVRQKLWQDAVHIFQDYPVVGSGSGTFSHLFRRYRSFRSTFIYEYAENDYLQLLAESGIVGVGLLFAAALLFFARALSSWKHQRSRWNLAVTSGGLCAMLSLLLHALVDFPFHIPANTLLFVVIAALCFSPAEGKRRGSHSAVPRIHPTVGLMLGFLLIGYSANAMGTYSAYRHHEVASELLSNSESSSTPLDAAQREAIIKHFKTAVRRDRNHAEYSAALGNFLIEHPDSSGRQQGRTHREKNFSLAEASLTRAIMLDPANPWYYYALGNLSYRRGDCEDVEWQVCPVTRYFSSALRNAPKNIFLRNTLGAWYAYFDRDVAYTFLKNIVEHDRLDPFACKEKSLTFAELLYGVGLDYDSDREAKFLRGDRSETCELKIIETDTPERHILELGNDDGTAEWKTALRLESDRVKKEICLPDNPEDYHTATLKILMNRVGEDSLDIRLHLDDQQVELPERQPSRLPAWYEIPVEIERLQGKSSLRVYLRAAAASAYDSSLLIWGDRDTPTNHSSLNFQQRKDLSSEEGVQQGEYMIRLVLKK